MCVVSNVTDFYYKQWSPIGESFQITRAEWEEYQRLKRNVQEIDKIIKQPDCIKPELDEWEKKIENYLIKRGIIHQNK